jgi:hypothetical protein
MATTTRDVKRGDPAVDFNCRDCDEHSQQCGSSAPSVGNLFARRLLLKFSPAARSWSMSACRQNFIVVVTARIGTSAACQAEGRNDKMALGSGFRLGASGSRPRCRRRIGFVPVLRSCGSFPSVLDLPWLCSRVVRPKVAGTCALGLPPFAPQMVEGCVRFCLAVFPSGAHFRAYAAI